jgi:CO dehydrogenase/acetyl-CoA synthase beta subunit
MNLFHHLIEDIRSYEANALSKGLCRERPVTTSPEWPAAGPRDIVLLPDLALEMGHPEDASLSCLLWTDDDSTIPTDRISLIGPDICETHLPRLPFGKIVLARTTPCDEDMLHDRYRAMDLARFDLSLKGYMLRAASQYMREWSRISREAVDHGFSLSILGSALIRQLKSLGFVRAVEIIFITRSSEDVNALGPVCEKADRLIRAMNKMLVETEADCGSCDYQDVCSDAAEMQALKATLAERQKQERSMAR